MNQTELLIAVAAIDCGVAGCGVQPNSPDASLKKIVRFWAEHADAVHARSETDTLRILIARALAIGCTRTTDSMGHEGHV